jgi:nucleoside-diphosphate-sugar epimerase
MSVGRDEGAGRVLVIAGCGYLGTALARLALGRGWRVLGICQSEETVRRLGLMGIAAVAADFTDGESLARVAGEVPEDACVVHCAAGGKGGGLEAYRTVYLEGMRRLREAFPGARRMLYTSSTSVYAGIDGGEVTEESAAEPERETGRVLRQTEEETLGAGGAVVRLAGIYGPGRSVLLLNFLNGLAAIDVRTEEPATPDGRWVNQIHRDDAAAAVLHLLEHPDGEVFHGGLYNVSDRTPLLQREIYERLAVRFGRPLPPEAVPETGRKRGWTHKRVSSARLRGTGWEPRYASWFDALDGDPELVPSILAKVG